jgi:hypothetical protein
MREQVPSHAGSMRWKRQRRAKGTAQERVSREAQEAEKLNGRLVKGGYVSQHRARLTVGQPGDKGVRTTQHKP